MERPPACFVIIILKGVDNVCMQFRTITFDSLSNQVTSCSVKFDGEACSSCVICQNGWWHHGWLFPSIDCSNILDPDAVDLAPPAPVSPKWIRLISRFLNSTWLLSAPPPSTAPSSGASAYDHSVHFGLFVALAPILVILSGNQKCYLVAAACDLMDAILWSVQE
jgi:hypothetical protein